MSDIFLSYAREDADTAKALAVILEKKGYSVWWDPQIPPGRTFDSVIEEALLQAKCVVVMWSNASIDSDWVREEASEARNRGILVPVLVEDITVPFGFRRIQAANLVKWHKDDSHPGFIMLLQAISKIAPPSMVTDLDSEKANQVKSDKNQPNVVKVDRSYFIKFLSNLPKIPLSLAIGGFAVTLIVAVWITFTYWSPTATQVSERKATIENKQYSKTETRLADLSKQVTKFEQAIRYTKNKSAREELYSQEKSLTAQLESIPNSSLSEESKQLLKSLKKRLAAIAIFRVGKEQPETNKNKFGMEFIYIPAGKFIMGGSSVDPNRQDSEPQHKVAISKPFLMQVTEVTQDQWLKVMGNNPSVFKKCGGNCPVENINWSEAEEFIKKLNKAEGVDEYRLPTEAEWEYAVRAGTNTNYYFGNDSLLLEQYAWYTSNSKGGPNPVEQKKPNPWGLYDMYGNVWEWCSDYYGAYSSNSQIDPRGSFFGIRKILRGGSWGSPASYLRSAHRHKSLYYRRNEFFGFRVVKDL